jgi:hypothetical protein
MARTKADPTDPIALDLGAKKPLTTRASFAFPCVLIGKIVKEMFKKPLGACSRISSAQEMRKTL